VLRECCESAAGVHLVCCGCASGVHLVHLGVTNDFFLFFIATFYRVKTLLTMLRIRDPEEEIAAHKHQTHTHRFLWILTSLFTTMANVIAATAFGFDAAFG